jgi:hypothetical protein
VVRFAGVAASAGSFALAAVLAGFAAVFALFPAGDTGYDRPACRRK